MRCIDVHETWTGMLPATQDLLSQKHARKQDEQAKALTCIEFLKCGRPCRLLGRDLLSHKHARKQDEQALALTRIDVSKARMGMQTVEQEPQARQQTRLASMGI